MTNILKCPGFKIAAKNISIIQQCTEFRTVIQKLANEAKKQIYVSTLYFGTDESVTGDFLKKIVANKSEDLKVNFLADYARSSRNDGHYMKIYNYFKHIDNLKFDFYLFTANGSNIDILPSKLREIYGVYHVKFLIFDDTIILTGANISKTYLSDRQDRYYLIKSTPKLTKFLIGYFDEIKNFCFKVYDLGLILPIDFHSNEKMSIYTERIRRNLQNYIQTQLILSDVTISDYMKDQNDIYEEQSLTVIYPLIQFGKSNLHGIDDSLKYIFEQFSHQMQSVYITSAYINFEKSVEEMIQRVSTRDCKIHLILPNPKTNSFHQSGFLMNHISGMYSLFMKKLVNLYINNDNIYLYEYKSTGSTYHAKGIWFEPPKFATKLPHISILGSSNFNRRAAVRDLEMNFALFTNDSNLRKQIGYEIDNIMNNSYTLNNEECKKSEYSVPPLCYLIQYISKSYL